MKKSIIKRLFIKISKIMGYEIIDQNNFTSPTLDKELNKDLSILNDKSIVLPLGEVKISRKVKSILVLFRTNSNIEIWDQNKKRLFELPKIEYTLRSLKSLLKSINFCKEKYSNIKIKLIIIDDNTNESNLNKIKNLISKNNLDIIFKKVDHYLYMDNEKTNVLIGNKRHWRTVSETLCTFMTSKKFLDKYWNNFYKTCLDRHDPFEKYINEIYKSEICVSPLKSLSVHFTNVNSSYGLSPFIDYKKLWTENE